MSKLVSANFARLWKSWVFWLCMTASFFMEIYMVWHVYDFYTQELPFSPFIYCFTHNQFNILIWIFAGIFIGTEFSDGIVKNKLTIGHSRLSVYASNLVVCMAVALFMYFIHTVAAVGAGVLLFGGFDIKIDMLLIYTLCNVMSTLAYAAVSVMFSMLIQRKSIAIITMLVLQVVMLFLVESAEGELGGGQGYYDPTRHYYHADAEITGYNPKYLSDTKRIVYEFFYDFMPSGQRCQMTGENKMPAHVARFPLYSLSIVVVSTACGVLVFRKKDLR